MNQRKGVLDAVSVALILLIVVAGGLVLSYSSSPQAGLKKFSSCSALASAFSEAQAAVRQYGRAEVLTAVESMAKAPGAAPDYSTTNVQVAGVDEADIVKTDGEFIYTISKGKLIITKAYPSGEAKILSEKDLGNFQASEMFTDSNTLMIFGSTRAVVPREQKVAGDIAPYPYYTTMTTVELWDISDKANPELVRSTDFEGNYLTSRKIGSQVYFVVNSYPRYYIMESGSEDIIPLYRDRVASEIVSGVNKSFEKLCRCIDVSHFEPVNPQNFVTIVSMSMSDIDAPITKEVTLGSGQNVYASTQNIYVAEMNYPFWRPLAEEGGETLEEKTIVHKFSLSDGTVSYVGNMEAPGRVLNQFSMDEHNGYFRIATTRRPIWFGGIREQAAQSTNNVYVYDTNLNQVGKLEDLAPGESIYSARFIRERGYLVTFKKIDPLFVIDLSTPSAPRILGKLKIPGYSDYLHPYDDSHIIGIGKEAVAAEKGDFAWYQGLKMALFDVTDVENPKELHKVVIGDRGTDSEVLRDHKAFLFDKERNLLVIPILLAEISGDKENLPSWTHGDHVYQGAYVYDLTIGNGFVLKGRITHYEEEDYLKSGYYLGSDPAIRRSLYIDNVLYTISQLKIKLNSLNDLSEIKELKFSGSANGKESRAETLQAKV